MTRGVIADFLMVFWGDGISVALDDISVAVLKEGFQAQCNTIRIYNKQVAHFDTLVCTRMTLGCV